MVIRTAAVALLLVAIGVALAGSACVGDDPAITSSADPDGAGGTGDGASPGDGSTPGEGGICEPGAKTCIDGLTLGTCGQASTKCALECSTTGGAHCTVIQPSAPATAADLAAPGVVSLTVSADGFLDTATGSIENVRPANGDPAIAETKAGIGFRLVSGVGIFTVKSLTVNSGATLKLRGAAAVAIVAAETIAIVGIVDARGYDANGVLCGVAGSVGNIAGPGGFVGGLPNGANDGSAAAPGGGLGISAIGELTMLGAGGGGFGGAGGDGGGNAASGGHVVLFPTPIKGGYGGGASGSNGAAGGGGGGALQLVAGTSIAIGGGANPGGVNAGGCGGSGAAFGETGSGGGSGGAILLQAPVVSLKTMGTLAANGGAGSTGNASGRGEHGKLSAAGALGPPAASGYGKGGDGASNAKLNGDPGGAGTGSGKGGAGGGGVGRIRIENRSGSLSVPAGAIVSPVVATGAAAATSVGTIVTK